MKISENGISLIKSFEGCKLTAYKAINTEKYHTIGWGHYGADVKAGQSISQSEADALFLSDLKQFVKYTNAHTASLKLSQNQFDALVSFCYNCGPGRLKKLVSGRTPGEIAEHITDLEYARSGGKVLKALERRRREEKELFCKGSGVKTMAVRIGHASISEKGTVNGTKGDQTGGEVCTRPWYSKPWGFMAVHPDAGVRERHARAVEAACANDNIGYGQSDRNTLNMLAKAVGYDLSKVGKCNCDCSSLQNVAAVASGAEGAAYGSNGWTTATMKAAMQKLGYKIITDTAYLASPSYCVRGAVYVKASSHTVCGLDNGADYKKTLAKAGCPVSTPSTPPVPTPPVPTPPASIPEGVPDYAAGKVYTTQVELNVRTGPGKGYPAKKHPQLTADGRKNDADKDGAIDPGTKVTCKEVAHDGADIWIKTPSGWMAAYYQGKVYIK